MGLLKVHYTAPRRAAYLNFAKSSGKPGHLESDLLIQDANEETAIWHTVIYRGFLGSFFP
jgi:hypothetical protein